MCSYEDRRNRTNRRIRQPAGMSGSRLVLDGRRESLRDKLYERSVQRVRALS